MHVPLKIKYVFFNFNHESKIHLKDETVRKKKKSTSANVLQEEYISSRRCALYIFKGSLPVIIKQQKQRQNEF